MSKAEFLAAISVADIKTIVGEITGRNVDDMDASEIRERIAIKVDEYDNPLGAEWKDHE